MDLRAEIDALVDVGPRAPGSDAERRAAFGSLVRRPIGSLEPLFWAELAVLLFCLSACSA